MKGGLAPYILDYMVLGDSTFLEGVIIIACTNPLKAFRKKNGEVVLMDRGSTEAYLASGRVDARLVRRYPFLNDAYGLELGLFDVPCGRCLSCRLKKAQEWSQRCILECKSWPDNWFVTLTYEDDQLQYGEQWATLVPDDHKNFLKRLREYYRDRGHTGIRFYMAGEYGDSTYRPHYHYILFNLPLTDLKYHTKSALGDAYFISPTLDNLWGKGHVIVGEVTPQSAAYVARYVQKKAIKDIDYDDLGICKEFTRMSNRPGIGLPYLVHHFEDIYKNDKIYLPDGQSCRPMRYFDDKAEQFGVDIQSIKDRRIACANVLNNIHVQKVSREYYEYLDDLEREFEKRSKVLTRTNC